MTIQVRHGFVFSQELKYLTHLKVHSIDDRLETAPKNLGREFSFFPSQLTRLFTHIFQDCMWMATWKYVPTHGVKRNPMVTCKDLPSVSVLKPFVTSMIKIHLIILMDQKGMLVLLLVAKSCPALFDPMNCSPPGASVHWISRQE